MTTLLFKLFLKDTDAASPAGRAAIGRLAGTAGMICNIFLACVKILAGVLSGSVAILGDGINNLTDSASSVVTLLGFRMAQRPADSEHPFGHGRYEYVSAAVVAILVVAAGLELAKSSVEKILHPEAVAISVLNVGILLGSVAVKLWMMFFYRSAAQKIHSQTLEAASQDSRNDVIATTAVLLSLLADALLHIPLDGWAGLAVAIFILWSGIQLVNQTVSPLLGKQADAELTSDLTELMESHEGVLGVHDLLVHDYGAGRCFATAHVEMDGNETPLQSHDRLDHIEQEALDELGVQLVLHYDPIVPDAEWERCRLLALNCAQSLVPGAKIHDLRIVQFEGSPMLSFDLTVPYAEPETDESIQEKLTSLLKERECGYDTQIRIDRNE